LSHASVVMETIMSKICRILVTSLSAAAARVLESTVGRACIASSPSMARPMIWVHLMDSEVTVAIISLCEVKRSQTGQLRLQEVQICVQDISFVTNIVLVAALAVEPNMANVSQISQT
jgi:hypothetical protein